MPKYSGYDTARLLAVSGLAQYAHRTRAGADGACVSELMDQAPVGLGRYAASSAGSEACSTVKVPTVGSVSVT